MYKKSLIFFAMLLLSACATTNDLDKNAQTAQLSSEQLGVRYLLGRGVKQNDKTAFDYFKQAAENNNPFAQNELAYLYFTGRGTNQDNAKAFDYYMKAAKQGLSSAQYNVAIFYERGIGTDPDAKLAQQWYQTAANNGFAPAKRALKQSEMR